MRTYTYHAVVFYNEAAGRIGHYQPGDPMREVHSLDVEAMSPESARELVYRAMPSDDTSRRAMRQGDVVQLFVRLSGSEMSPAGLFAAAFPLTERDSVRGLTSRARFPVAWEAVRYATMEVVA